MGLINYKGRLINDDRYAYPSPEIIVQTTRNASDILYLGFGDASNDNGYIYFYADADWKENPSLYIGESKNNLQSRHNATHKNTAWFKAIQYPFIGIVNSPNRPWDTDTRRAIESLTKHKAHAAGFQIINSTNSTWTNGGTVHPNVHKQYVDAVSEIIVSYLIHHTGWEINSKPAANSMNIPSIQTNRENLLSGPKKYHIEVKNERPIAPPKKQYNVPLADIISAGYIKVGETLYSTEAQYPGTAFVEENGTVSFNGVGGLSLSAAGGNCRKLVKPEIAIPNGWDFWAVKDDSGKLRKILEYRDLYLKSKIQ